MLVYAIDGLAEVSSCRWPLSELDLFDFVLHTQGLDIQQG